MFLGNFNVANSVENENIPINTLISTNRKVVNNTSSNVLELRKPGIYNIDGWMTVSGATGTVEIQVWEDDTFRDAIAVTTTSDDQLITVPIVDAVRAVIARYPETARIYLRVDESGFTLAGVIRVEYLQ